MDNVFLLIYGTVSIIVGFVDLVIAYGSFQRKEEKAQFLSQLACSACLVDVFYLMSVLSKSRFSFSITSSLYFISIDLMLISLLQFIIEFTRKGKDHLLRRGVKFCTAFAVIEFVYFIINPFYEKVIGYSESGFSVFAKYAYDMKGYPLFFAHLTFTYGMLILVFVLLIHKAITTPKQYRNPYVFILLSILAIVGINAIFLYTKQIEINIYNVIDYSILGYSFVLYMLFWSCFRYSEHDMLKGLSKTIFDDLDQGIVLFDYDQFFVMSNGKATSILESIFFEKDHTTKDFTMKDFTETINLPEEAGDKEDFYTFQTYIQSGESRCPYRCDYRCLKDEKGYVLGYLYVFTAITMEIDLLTGYYNWEYFVRYVNDNRNSFSETTTALVCDITGLAILNNRYGKEHGNQKIHELSELLKQEFAKESYFVRGTDANLVVVQSGRHDITMRTSIESVIEKYDLKIQYAIGIGQKRERIIENILDAKRAMMTNKLLDSQSSHSQILQTLVKAMQQMDSDTEAHVKRTQYMGALLGKRIGLSDLEQGNLSLLCLMHDIGKIGVPLEILNKPGKLSKEEVEVLKSHVQKGYQIAITSREFHQIADMILHHHERWDGKGYPDGIKGKEIPLLARIICVVDSYDAMINDRPYRKGRSPEDAIEELRKCAGTQFDPYITEEFLELLEEKPSLKKKRTILNYTDQNDQPKNYQVINTQLTKLVTYSRYIITNHGRIVDTDAMFETITGYSEEDLEKGGLNHFDLIPDSDRGEYTILVNDALSKGNFVFLQHRIRRKDGTIISVHCYGRRYYDSAINAERNEIIISYV